MQFIEYEISIEDTEQQFGSISVTNSHMDFFAALQSKSFQLNYRSLPANETAIEFATKHSQNLFVTYEEGKNELLTTVHFAEFNGFLSIAEITHTLTIADEELLKIKASIEKNKAKKFKLIIFPEVNFFHEINQYKLGKNGKSMNSQIKYLVDCEF